MNGANPGSGYMSQINTSSQFERTAFHNERDLAKIRTLIPCRVVAVYAQGGGSATRGSVAGAGFVDVQPMVSQMDGSGNRMDHGTVFRIPFTRIYGGDAAIICDPVVGDVGWIQCSDRDTSTFNDQVTQGSTQPVLPGSRRRHDMTDSMYVGGVLNKSPAQYVTFSNDGITIHDKNNNQVVMTDSGITITDKNNNQVVMDSSGITLTPSGSTVKINGNLDVTGTITADSGGGSAVGLTTHTHAGVTTGSGDTASPNPGT